MYLLTPVCFGEGLDFGVFNPQRRRTKMGLTSVSFTPAFVAARGFTLLVSMARDLESLSRKTAKCLGQDENVNSMVAVVCGS